MIRRPPRSTLFPTRRSSDLAALMSRSLRGAMDGGADALVGAAATDVGHGRVDIGVRGMRILRDRKSTRLNSSHLVISYAVFCLKKKNKTQSSTPMLAKVKQD